MWQTLVTNAYSTQVMVAYALPILVNKFQKRTEYDSAMNVLTIGVTLMILYSKKLFCEKVSPDGC